MMRGSKLDDIMTIVFMILALGAGVCFLFMSDRSYALAFGGIAIVLRIIQYILRYLK